MKHHFRRYPRSLFALGAVVMLSHSAALVQAAPETAKSPEHTARGALLCYQAALDELTQGQLENAQAVLENGIHSYGDAPELNLLLGYVLEREGKAGKAQDRISRVTAQSALAREYAQQLTVPAGVANDEDTSVAVVPVAALRTAPHGASTLITSLPQNDERLAQLEATMVEMVNAERRRAGLNELTTDAGLANVARAHSGEMRDIGYFSHESPTPALRTHVERYRAVYHNLPRLLAENIYRAWGSPHTVTLDDVKTAHEALMKSPGHRENILLPNVSKIGIGIVVNANGDLWITQMFSRN
jgi:uncharacterized protein YkwD